MYSVTIEFKDKKTYNKFKRNMKNGKGTNIKPSDIHGDGIFDTLKSVANSKITKGIVKAVAPVIVGAVASRTGPMGASLANAGLNAYAGSGFLDIVKGVANSKITKGLVKTLAPVVANQIQQRTGSNLAGSPTSGALNAYSGSGANKVVSQSGIALPANVLPSGPNQDLDLKATMRARMANVRAHRKRGGSVNPLGSR
jgi:hypothetical protein